MKKDYDLFGLFDLFDTHTHTNISDGADSPEKMLTAAAQKGVKVIALTDHFDIHDRFPEELSVFDGAGREESYRILSGLKESKKHDSGIKYLNGIEIAQAHHYKETAESWLDSHEYDFVLASCHVIRGHSDFYHMDYKKNNPDVLLEQYFAELQELCLWETRFDSLAHMTYPLRYMPAGTDLDRHKSAVDEVLRIMVKNEIALEINTQRDIICPEFPQVRRFYELGGRLITIGSDAHSANTIAQRIDRGIQAAKSAGFAECVYYEERKPKFIKI